ncbi:hypothetical protein P9112_003097 [Eukaryota sp. TZLM1-RC]
MTNLGDQRKVSPNLLHRCRGQQRVKGGVCHVVRILLLSNVLSYAAGGRYSLILTSDHKLYSCGRNDFFQCGVGDETLMATCDYSELNEPIGPFGSVVIPSLTLVDSKENFNIELNERELKALFNTVEDISVHLDDL